MISLKCLFMEITTHEVDILCGWPHHTNGLLFHDSVPSTQTCIPLNEGNK